MKKFFPILFVLALVFAGCKKEILFSGDEGKEYVVVMAQLQPDSVAVVNLSYSRFFLSSESPRHIDDASMTLWVNGTPYAPIAVHDGDYQFPVSPTGGDSVWFEAEVPGHGTLFGATRMVAYPQVENTIVTSSTGFEFWRMMDLQYLQFDLTDPAPQKDYYKFEVIERDQCVAHDELPEVDTIYLSYFLYLGLKEVGDTASPNIFDAEMAMSMTISDSAFSGLTKSVALMSTPVVDTTGLTERTYWVRVSAYSPEIYQFRKSAALASSSYAMFAEPMQVYSNIKGDAIGVFGSLSTRVLKADRLSATERGYERSE